MNDTEINLITNMSGDSGIGNYALELYRITHDYFPQMKLFSVPYIRGQKLDNSINLSTFYAGNILQIPFVNKFNFKRIKKSKQFEQKNIHILGSDYSLVSASEKAVATVHEYYFTVAGLQKSTNARSFLREIGYNYGMIKLHSKIKRFKKIIAPSHYSAAQIRSHTGIKPEVVHETVDGSRFHYRDKKASRKLLGLPNSKVLLLNVSGDGINKNLHILKKISDSLSDDYRLIKIGAPIYSKNSINIGRVEDKYYSIYFNAADAYLNVSTNEGFNIPLIESMKSSLPVISNKCATAPELLGESGIYVENPDMVQEYLELIHLGKDLDSLNYYSELINKRCSEFSDDKARREYIRIYSDVFR